MGQPRADVNATIAGLLSDLAALQTIKMKKVAFTRAADVVMRLDAPVDTLVDGRGALAKLSAIGASSAQVILEVIESGRSPTVERAVAESGRADEVTRWRAQRSHFLSRVGTLRVLSTPARGAVGPNDYRGDFQMHSTWSDGVATVPELALACAERGYEYFAVTDHSHGLAFAGGLSMGDAARQHAEIDAVNQAAAGRLHVIKGLEANVLKDGSIDVAPADRARFDMVLAAPHSQLRETSDQTSRMLRAVSAPGVHILAHPRGRQTSRTGIVADWDVVFEVAARHRVAIEIDGDPNRQDLDHAMARRAYDAGCLIALDSDAHRVHELAYADTAIAHARLARIPPERIINCWTFKKLAAWMKERRSSSS